MVNSRDNVDVSIFKVYKLFLMKEQAIFQHLNTMKMDSTFFSGLVWVPSNYEFQATIDKIIKENGFIGFNYEKCPEIDGLTKPSLFQQTDFLWSF